METQTIEYLKNEMDRCSKSISDWENAVEFIGPCYVRLIDKNGRLMDGQHYVGDDFFKVAQQHAITYYADEMVQLKQHLAYLEK